jgi:hypothetical protein
MTLGAMPSAAGRNDVGGDKGEQATGIILHGGRGDDGRTNWDGMSTNVFFGGGGGMERTYYFNTTAIQEIVIDTGGSNAETETGGANVNIVPREGGNTFRVFGTANYTNEHLSATAVPDDVKGRGVTDQSSLKRIYDYGIGIGGPIKRDKLWFYATARWWDSDNLGASNYFNKSTNPYVYVPDTSRPAYAAQFYVDDSLRVTWQITSKQKLNQEEHLQYGCSCWLGIGNGQRASPEAVLDFNYGPQVLNQTTWSYTATNRLLIQAGTTLLRQEVNFVNGVATNANLLTGIGAPVYPGPNNFSIIDLATGYNWGGLGFYNGIWGNHDNSNNYNERVSVSYITGSHAFKTGVQGIQGNYDVYGFQNGRLENYIFYSGFPVALIEWAGPFASKARPRGIGAFAQDQWKLNRFTLSFGVRFDQFWAYTLPLDLPAGKYIAARHVNEADNLPNYKDITPRVGAAYDVFGNGKTAIKFSFGRYLMGQGGALAQSFSPSNAIVQSASRTWFDLNGNFVPDCVLTNPAANGECGPISNALFGQPFSNTTLADDARQGWGKREYNYQTSVQLQHELRPGLGVAIGYYRTWWGNLTVLQNTAVTSADFTQFCVAAPNDARLGPTSGQQICGFYDVNPNKFGAANYVVTQASRFGTPQEEYNGVDIGINARWGKGALVTGGVAVGRETFDYCYANGHPELTPENFPGNAAFSGFLNPRNAQFCRVVSSWWNGIGSQVKLQVVYPLPYGISVSAAYKTLPGIPVQATQVFTNAQVAPALGRSLSSCPPGPASACTATATLALIPTGGFASDGVKGTVFDLRLNQTDLRFTKAVRIGRSRAQGIFDIYNVFNSRVPQADNTTYGPGFLTPTSLLGGRLFKFGAQVDW